MLSDSDIRERLGPLADPGLSPSDNQRPPRRRLAPLAFVALLLWIGGLALLLHYERTAPHRPDPRTGQVCRFTDTRHTVYLTRKQRSIAWGALGIPILGTLGIAFFAIPRRPPEQ